MTKHYYQYFISYYYLWRPKANFLSMTNKPYQQDIANVTINRDKAIETVEDINEITTCIAKMLDKTKDIADEKVIIIFFRLMKEYDEESED